MSVYSDRDSLFMKGYSLELPRQNGSIHFTEGVGGIHLRVFQGPHAMSFFLSSNEWEELGELKYVLHPRKLQPIDKVKKAMDQVPREDDDEDGT